MSYCRRMCTLYRLWVRFVFKKFNKHDLLHYYDIVTRVLNKTQYHAHWFRIFLVLYILLLKNNQSRWVSSLRSPPRTREPRNSLFVLEKVSRQSLRLVNNSIRTVLVCQTKELNERLTKIKHIRYLINCLRLRNTTRFCIRRDSNCVRVFARQRNISVFVTICRKLIGYDTAAYNNKTASTPRTALENSECHNIQVCIM